MTWYIEGIGIENPRSISYTIVRKTSKRKVLNGGYHNFDRGVADISLNLTIEQLDTDWVDGNYNSSITYALMNEIMDDNNPEKSIITDDGRFDGLYLISNFSHNQDAVRPNLIIYNFSITQVLK